MEKLLRLSCSFIFLISIVATATASNIDFSVNDGGYFYVKSSQILSGATSPPGQNASSTISGSNFHLTINGGGYADAGIVLFFNGGFRLGDLQSVSVVETGSQAINLWLDTGNDGMFFAFDGTGRLTGLNGDSYGSTAGSFFDANSVVNMQGGVSGSYTLAQLQSGVAPGIDSNTLASLWIGISGNTSRSADISSVTVSLNDVTVIFPRGVVTFDSVASSCITDLTPVSTPTHKPPANFRFVGNGYFDITTDCSFSGNVTVTLPYNESQIIGQEKNLKLFHWKNNGWKNVTVSINTVNNTITGRVTSLSPFAIGYTYSSGASAGGQYASGANENIVGLIVILAFLVGVFILRRKRLLRKS